MPVTRSQRNDVPSQRTGGPNTLVRVLLLVACIAIWIVGFRLLWEGTGNSFVLDESPAGDAMLAAALAEVSAGAAIVAVAAALSLLAGATWRQALMISSPALAFLLTPILSIFAWWWLAPTLVVALVVVARATMAVFGGRRTMPNSPPTGSE